MNSTQTPRFTNEKDKLQEADNEDKINHFKTYQVKPNNDTSIFESGFSFTNDLLSQRTYGFLKSKEECLEEMQLDDRVPEEIENDKKKERNKVKKGKTEKVKKSKNSIDLTNSENKDNKSTSNKNVNDNSDKIREDNKDHSDKIKKKGTSRSRHHSKKHKDNTDK